MTEEEAYKLLKQKVDILKAHSHDKKTEYPEYYNGFNKLCKEYDSIRVHSVPGVFPDKLFKERSPNQTDQEFKFIKENYQQTANLPVFMDFVSTAQRAFNDGNWKVDYKQGEGIEEDYREYVEEEIPVFISVENYVRHILPANKLRDAMGVSVVKPKIKFKQSGDEIVEDDQELRTPEIFYFPVNKVLTPPNLGYYILESPATCYLEEEKENSGRIFWVVDEVNFFIFHQKKRSSDWYFELVETIPHNSEEVPVDYLKGIPSINEHGHLVYQSQFIYAVPALNVVVLDQSYLQISKDKTAFPVQVMIGNECNFIDPATNGHCYGGDIEFINTEGVTSYAKCPKCKGTGMKSRISPQGTLLLRGKTRENPEGERVSDALTYISPETNTMELLRTEIKENVTHARTILHLKGDSGSGENVVESANQNKSLNAFIKPISDQMFAHYEWLLNIIGMQRYGKDYPKPTLIYPQSFEFLTDKDYLFLIKEAQAAGAPPFVIHSLIWKYLSSIFYTDMDAAKISELIMKSDRLVTLTTQDIQQGILNKTIEPWEKILHDSGITLVLQLQQSNENFWDENTDRMKLLVDLAKLRATEIKASTTAGTGVPAFIE